MEPSIEGILTICSNGSTSVNNCKMATMHIYSKKKKQKKTKKKKKKTLKFFIFSRPKKTLRLNLGI